MSTIISLANKILNEIAYRNGMDSLSLTQEGTAGLRLKNGIRIFFECIKSLGKLHVYTPLMTAPKDAARRQAICEAILNYNFVQLGCGPGSLAIFLHTEEIVYQTGFDIAALDADRLEIALHDMINQHASALYQMNHVKIPNPALTNSSQAQSTYNRLIAAARIDVKV